MKPALIALAAALLLVIGRPAAAADLSGKYTVEGRDPGGQSYVGEVEVMKKGATYHVLWVLGDSRAIGTGIQNGRVFAVTYVMRGVPLPGIAIYDIARDGRLSGRFTMLGQEVVGDETWTPLGGDRS
jgi:hypothetical protein